MHFGPNHIRDLGLIIMSHSVSPSVPSKNGKLGKFGKLRNIELSHQYFDYQ